MTHVIVVYRHDFEHGARLRNLSACLSALHHQAAGSMAKPFSIYLVEQDSKPRAEVGQVIEKVGAGAIDPVWEQSDRIWSRARAFNFGVLSVKPGTSDLLCLIDADILVTPDWIGECQGIMRGADAMLPYTWVNYLTEEASSIARNAGVRSVKPLDTERRAERAKGGCLWIRAWLFRKLGGFNPTFEGWGGEDDELFDRMKVLAPIIRIYGPLWHLWHPPVPEKLKQARVNTVRLDVYRTKEKPGEPLDYST